MTVQITYTLSNSFSFDYETNGTTIVSQSERKLTLRSYCFQFKSNQKLISLRLSSSLFRRLGFNFVFIFVFPITNTVRWMDHIFEASANSLLWYEIFRCVWRLSMRHTYIHIYIYTNCTKWGYTRRIFFWILVNQTKFEL